MKKHLIIASTLLILGAGRISAHGILLEPSFHYPSVIVMSSYSASQPTAGAAVTIYSPSAPDKPFQKGETDLKGKFAFIPDTEGDWKCVVDDQKGHRESIAINVTAQFLNPVTEASPAMAETKPAALPEPEHEHEPAMPLLYKIFTGLSAIFGLTGIFYGLRSAKKHNK